MKKFIICFVKAILAGFLIGIGATTNLYLKGLGYTFLGAVMFTFGLIFICFFDLNLYTGKIGFFFDNDKEFKINIIYIILGNIVGASLFGFMMHATNIIDSSTYNEFVNSKIINFNNFSFNWFIKFFLNSMLAGILVYLGTIAFKKFTNPIMEVLGIVFSITIMVLLKGEHSIANVVYYSLFYDQIDHIGVIISFVIAAIGNGIGSILLHLLFKISNQVIKKENKQVENINKTE